MQRKNQVHPMKTATLPSLRVAPELRRAAERVLAEGETLSQLIEHAVREEVGCREAQAEFLQRGLASRDAARETGVYVSAADVLNDLHTKLESARRRHAP
ncbi:MAG TPA: YlcI/YnfO family protein [Castellaniella sp.]|uniref:YlcI/YnfO family protein n=1 Tax=Castellaniella sp. TaxID=1955812 RepID=UPI002F2321B7